MMQASTKTDATLIGSSSGTKSWVDVVAEEGMHAKIKQTSIWDSFDISKGSNTGFKLEYVAPNADLKLVEIELEDISSEIEYWRNSVVCYVMGAYPPFSVIKVFV